MFTDMTEKSVGVGHKWLNMKMCLIGEQLILKVKEQSINGIQFSVL
jgi:hypothetical protein